MVRFVNCIFFVPSAVGILPRRDKSQSLGPDQGCAEMNSKLSQ
jgi:hypothetical protein